MVDGVFVFGEGKGWVLSWQLWLVDAVSRVGAGAGTGTAKVKDLCDLKRNQSLLMTPTEHWDGIQGLPFSYCGNTNLAAQKQISCPVQCVQSRLCNA